MCGIVGIVHPTNTSRIVDESVITRMTDKIAHRGPDDSGIYISQNKKVGLGFRRLSIVDLSYAGHQPMSDESLNYWMIFNGEIYNYKEIKNELLKKGYKFRSNTDTEVILNGYIEYGIDIISKLNGMFAIALWDEKQQILYVVRDRLGIKPLYFYCKNNSFAFGSEIKSIIEFIADKPTLNHQAFADYLTYLSSPPVMSFFNDINKMMPGHIIEYSVRTGDMRQYEYWDVQATSTQSDNIELDEEDYIEKIRSLLKESIQMQMMADVPFGVLLSGGIDSSLNVALMSEVLNQPVETFSIGTNFGVKYNEFQYARQVASLYKTNHHEILIDEKDAFNCIDSLVWHLDEPNADPVCIPLYHLSKFVRQSGTIVVQVGEGSDELFSGYQHYIREYQFYNKFYNVMPNFISKGAYNLSNMFYKYHPITEYFRRSSYNNGSFIGGASTAGFTEHLKGVMNLSLNTDPASKISVDYMNKAKEKNFDYLNQMIYFELKNRLAELLLMRVDKMSMAHSIEARVPFLDHRLVELAMKIPEQFKIKNKTPKYILKKSCEGILPNSIIYRKKQGFAAPISIWMKDGELGKYAVDNIVSSKLVSQKIIPRDFVKNLHYRHCKGYEDHSERLWSLLMVARWIDKFDVGIDN